MTVISVIRRVPGVVVAMVAIAAVMVVSQPARSYTGAIGYVVNVKANPTVGLADGQAVAVHVETVGGITMFDVQAHLCQAGAGIKNGFEFDLDGPFCSPSRASPAADAAVDQRGGGSSADLTFHVGIGTGAPWNETDGGTHTLTCGPGAPCDLVLQVAMSEQNFYHAIPLCFGDGCGPEPGTAPAPVAGSTGTDTSGAAGANAGRGERCRNRRWAGWSPGGRWCRRRRHGGRRHWRRGRHDSERWRPRGDICGRLVGAGCDRGWLGQRCAGRPVEDRARRRGRAPVRSPHRERDQPRASAAWPADGFRMNRRCVRRWSVGMLVATAACSLVACSSGSGDSQAGDTPTNSTALLPGTAKVVSFEVPATVACTAGSTSASFPVRWKVQGAKTTVVQVDAKPVPHTSAASGSADAEVHCDPLPHDVVVIATLTPTATTPPNASSSPRPALPDRDPP